MHWLLTATHALLVGRPAALSHWRAAPQCSSLAWECSTAEEAALVQLCAKTDRGQRCTETDQLRFDTLISTLESEAPAADATLLNGRWRLLYASETPYRSSPFFWAFRQATSGMTTPVALPGWRGVAQGDPVSEAVYAITDAIPFYELGAVEQTISGACSMTVGCTVPEGGSETDGGAEQDEPSDGSFGGPPPPGSLVSQVELTVSRLFGLPVARSLMTTTASLSQPPQASDEPTGGPIDVLLTIETTSAAESSIASLLPPLGQLLENFPSGAALEAARKGSATVRLRTTYLTGGLRISRAVLDLPGGQDASAVFVYSREA